MKKTLFLIVLFYSQLVFAQTNMNIFLNNGTSLQIPLMSIDSITYSNVNNGLLPTISTLPVSSICYNSAASGGDITSIGGSSIIDHGLCWSTSPNPTIADSVNSQFSGGLGVFSANVYFLIPNTNYYIRAYATNNTGTAYGNEIQIFNPGYLANVGCSGGQSTLADYDGNIYNIITIGGQCWMKENLKTTHYRNGLVIPYVSVGGSVNGSMANYNNDPNNSLVYGKLYDWYAIANPNGLCPAGWHVPARWEWNILINTIDKCSDTTCVSCTQSGSGGELKEIGLIHWASPNGEATNLTGFTALPGGYYDSNTYSGLGNYGFWWSATADYNNNSSAFYYGLSYWNRFLDFSSFNKYSLMSIRCLKD